MPWIMLHQVVLKFQSLYFSLDYLLALPKWNELDFKTEIVAFKHTGNSKMRTDESLMSL